MEVVVSARLSSPSGPLSYCERDHWIILLATVWALSPAQDAWWEVSLAGIFWMLQKERYAQFKIQHRNIYVIPARARARFRYLVVAWVEIFMMCTWWRCEDWDVSVSNKVYCIWEDSVKSSRRSFLLKFNTKAVLRLFRTWCAVCFCFQHFFQKKGRYEITFFRIALFC